MLTRNLPPLPSYATVAKVKPLVVGEPIAAYAGREKVARLWDERALWALIAWEAEVKKCYATNRC